MRGLWWTQWHWDIRSLPLDIIIPMRHICLVPGSDLVHPVGTTAKRGSVSPHTEYKKVQHIRLYSVLTLDCSLEGLTQYGIVGQCSCYTGTSENLLNVWVFCVAHLVLWSAPITGISK